MEEILKLKKFYELKRIERFNTNGNRKESSAEHSWSCLILADYFFQKDTGLNKLKVYDLLIYHDVVEIESGDTPTHLEDKSQKEREALAAKTLKEKLPKKLSKKFYSLFEEFEEQKTQEAKFAKAIDKLDAIIQALDHKSNWQGWTEEILRKRKETEIKKIPSLQKEFEKIIIYLKEEKYLDQ